MIMGKVHPGFYHKWLLCPILLGQTAMLTINLLYCFIAIGMAIRRASGRQPAWNWEAFYPLRTILIAILALHLLAALFITLVEGMSLIRHSLRPGKLLLLELSKTPIWLVWSNMVGLSFFNMMGRDDRTLTFGILLFSTHILGFLVLHLPIPYAVFMYMRDRRGYYNEQNSTGWSYENGQWVPPEKQTDILVVDQDDLRLGVDEEVEIVTEETVEETTTDADTDTTDSKVIVVMARPAPA